MLPSSKNIINNNYSNTRLQDQLFTNPNASTPPNYFPIDGLSYSSNPHEVAKNILRQLFMPSSDSRLPKTEVNANFTNHGELGQMQSASYH